MPLVITEMNMVNLKECFFALVSPPMPTDWEAEENLEQLLDLPARQQELILQQIPAIWPVSNSLCYSYLASVRVALECLPELQIAGWVRAILDTYEEQGLRAAQNFMTDAEGNYLCRLRGEPGVELAALPHLQTYAQGVAGQPLRLAPSLELGTDTETIFLPAKITTFATPGQNTLYYKLLVTIQAGLVKLGTYQLGLSRNNPLVQKLRVSYPASGALTERVNLSDFFKLFPNQHLAAEIFTLCEAKRLLNWLTEALPGLWRDSQPLFSQLAKGTPSTPQPVGSACALTFLRSLTMGAISAGQLTGRDATSRLLAAFYLSPAMKVDDSAAKTAAIYAQLQGHNYDLPMLPLPWLGRLHPEAAWQIKMQKRQESKAKFIQGLAQLLLDAKPLEEPVLAEVTLPIQGSGEQSPTAALLLAPAGKLSEPLTAPGSSQQQKLLTLETLATELPESLRELGSEITNDLGHIPAEYISAAQGQSGRGGLAKSASAASFGESLTQTLTYEEWDFRRKGYRKEWCAVIEKILPPVKSSLIETTLAKYRGQLSQLRKQFELLRTGERFVRRQRDGSDFDLDAVIESLSDQRAGRAGSEQLFIRLRRDQRDIAVFFLVDMSSSTEGWVNLALKEALILTGETLQNIGDRFAIAGFSGMRRSRCDFFLVKDFTEAYNDKVKGRICAITPREYTRMGPALRHSTHLLEKVEARVRLLFVLSDGKPEDYDDYKGNYAIEDTRKALLEAKAAGVHPFCLTIDRQAHDYMSHMYGEVNYVFLDDIRKLPQRLPAIYRNLTT